MGYSRNWYLPVFIWCDGWDDGEEEMSDAAVDTICFTIVVVFFLWAAFK